MEILLQKRLEWNKLMYDRLSRKGWIALIGPPTLFLCGFLLFYYPCFLHMPVCAVKSFLNIDCPGCGLTRSITYLTHLNIRRSIYFHPMGVIISIWLVFEFALSLLTLCCKNIRRPRFSTKAYDIILISVLLGMFIQWIFKLVF